MKKCSKLLRKCIADERGMSILLALMLIFVVAVLATALYNYAMTDIKSVQTETDVEKAQYLAKAGIISAVTAWKEHGDKEGIAKTTNIYQMPDGTFSSDADGSVGNVFVDISTVNKTINEVTSSVTEFEATAEYNNSTRKMKASTSPISLGGSLNWFTINNSNHTAVLKGNHTSSNTMRNYSYFESIISAIFGSGSSASSLTNFKYSYFDGIAKCEPSADITKFVMNSSDSENKVILYAQAIFMERPLDMATGSDKYSVLVMQSKDIHFKGSIDLYYSPLRSSVGTVIISCPDGVGYKVDNEYWGKVFFEGDVNLHVRGLFGTTKYTIFKKGETYFFKQAAGGIDLIKYALDNKNINVQFENFYTGNDYDSDDMTLIPKTSQDAIPLSPEALTTIIWN